MCPLFRGAQFNNSNGAVLRPKNLSIFEIQPLIRRFHYYNIYKSYNSLLTIVMDSTFVLWIKIIYTHEKSYTTSIFYPYNPDDINCVTLFFKVINSFQLLIGTIKC